MSNNRGKEIRVGALIALGLIVIFGAFFVIGGQEGIFKKKYELQSRFTTVEGLSIGAAVRLGGVQVGNVSKITFAPDGTNKQVVVTMAVDASSFDKIRKDSFARIGGQGLLGDRTIDITIGTPSEGVLMPGDSVKTAETAGFSELVSEGGNAMVDIKAAAHNLKEITYKIDSGTGSLAEIINDPRLYTNLDSLLNMWSDITNKINRGEGTLAKFVNDPTLYNNLSTTLSEIDNFMANINDGKGSLGKLVKEDVVYNNLDSLLSTANITLAKINNGNGTASQLVNNANLYARIDSTLTALNELIVDIKMNPKKYVKLSLF
jgi:phospholipid/cholesterol/gamma-HCH transport system substrate-binding protein